MTSTIKPESVVPDKPLRTAQANLGRHFTHMHLTPFSQSMAQMNIVRLIVSQTAQ